MKVTLENLGTVNKNVVCLRKGDNKLYIYFSYETPIAYEYQMETICRKNDWSVTTGKFMNTLEADKSKRIDGEVFEAKLDELLSKLF